MNASSFNINFRYHFRFFPNEVMRVPLYEVVPIELIMSPCWVLDLNTYCKGRPLGATEEHVYICEYRVDKTARLFSKISKSKYPVCTKSYAFDRFDVRLKISRTYTPHELDNVQVKPRGRRPHESDDRSYWKYWYQLCDFSKKTFIIKWIWNESEWNNNKVIKVWQFGRLKAEFEIKSRRKKFVESVKRTLLKIKRFVVFNFNFDRLSVENWNF